MPTPTIDDPRIARILEAAAKYLDTMLQRQAAVPAPPEPGLVLKTYEPRPYPLTHISNVVASPDGSIVAILEDGRTFALRGGMTEWIELAKLPVPMVEPEK